MAKQDVLSEAWIAEGRYTMELTELISVVKAFIEEIEFVSRVEPAGIYELAEGLRLVDRGLSPVDIHILSCPVLVVVVAVFAHLTAVAQILRHFADRVMKLKISLSFIFDFVVTERRSEYISGRRAGRIAVAAVVDRRDYAF